MSTPIADKPWVRIIGTYRNPDKLAISIKCIQCKETHSFTILEENFDKWRNGELIQNCFTTLDEDDRELFISGMCGRCFDELVPE